MLTVINIEPTPDENTQKYIVNMPFLPGRTITYNSVKDCKQDTLAVTLFQIYGIKSITYADDYIAITKLDNASWASITENAENVISSTPPIIESFDDIETPTPEKPAPDGKSIIDDSMSMDEKVQIVFEKVINPAIASHGGFVSLVGVKDNKVILNMGGGCQGCGMVDATLKQGIETILQEQISPDLVVVDQTDHASGMSPYYSPGV